MLVASVAKQLGNIRQLALNSMVHNPPLAAISLLTKFQATRSVAVRTCQCQTENVRNSQKNVQGVKVMQKDNKQTVNNHNETVLVVEKCFVISGKAIEIAALVEEYKSLRWNSFHGKKCAIRRIIEIDKRFEELGV